MNKLSVVLCDDDGQRVQRWQDVLDNVPDLSEHIDVTALSPSDFAIVYEALEQRQLAARREAADASTDAAAILDNADIVIVDFDLTPRQPEEIADTSLTQLVGSFGDVFAYLTRCYSTAGFTVLVNQTFFQPTFDLTMVEFNYSFADLNISDSDLGRRSLWFGQSSGAEFRPWHWPRLLSAPEHMRRLSGGLALDVRVVDQFGWDDEILSLLELSQTEPLGLAPDREISDLRFGDFSNEKSRFGRRSASERLSSAQEQRLAAAAVSHWLERVLLPAQNVYVDAPHLAERRPDLVKTEDWAALSDLTVTDLTPYLDVVPPDDEAAKFLHWVSRPVWLTLDIPEPSMEQDAPASHVFCEDISGFRTAADAVEYRSSVAGPWTQRFVSKDLAEPTIKTHDLDIDFRPETRFYE